MKVQESAENYLEAILVLTQQRGQVRSVDIAGHMGFSKPSVSIAMKRLRGEGYISVDGDGYLSLLEPGRQIAEKIYERHCIIAQILMSLGVDEKTAFSDSCKIEHVISEKSFSMMKAHFDLNS